MAALDSRTHRATALPAAFVRRSGLALAALLALAPARAGAQDPGEVQALVDKATATVRDFWADPDMTWFRDHVADAKAVMVIPVLLKAGFILGGSGGHGALLWRDPASGAWSYPAFTFMGSVTFGLQIGGEAAEVVLMIMTERGKDALLSREFKLGADVSVAAGPTGAGASAATADVLAFSRSKGLFGGLTVEGAVIEPRDSWNQDYYGRPLSPSDILVKRAASNPGADPLRRIVARSGGGSAASTPAASAPAPYDLAAIQRALSAKGYDPGPADGLMGPKTREAIRQFQRDNGFPVTGRPTAELERTLKPR